MQDKCKKVKNNSIVSIIETCYIYLCKRNFKENQMKAKRKINTLIVGIGGAGCNIVQSISLSLKTEHADVIMADTDASRLELLKAHGFKTLACNEKSNILNSFSTGFDRVFLVGGLGGKTATQFMVELANDIKKRPAIEVVTVVTLPFKFEGDNCAIKAHTAVEILKALDVKCVILPNDNLLEKYCDVNMFNAFQMSDYEVKSIILAEMESHL